VCVCVCVCVCVNTKLISTVNFLSFENAWKMIFALNYHNSYLAPCKESEVKNHKNLSAMYSYFNYYLSWFQFLHDFPALLHYSYPHSSLICFTLIFFLFSADCTVWKYFDLKVKVKFALLE
jgi:GT2 family glycosyltransferase